MTNPEPFVSKGINQTVTLAALQLGADTEYIPRGEIIAEAQRLNPDLEYYQLNNGLSNGARIKNKIFTSRKKNGKRHSFKLTVRGHQMASDASLEQSMSMHPSAQDEFFETLETALAEMPEPVTFSEVISLDDGRSIVEDRAGNVYVADFQHIGSKGVVIAPQYA